MKPVNNEVVGLSIGYNEELSETKPSISMRRIVYSISSCCEQVTKIRANLVVDKVVADELT